MKDELIKMMMDHYYKGAYDFSTCIIEAFKEIKQKCNSLTIEEIIDIIESAKKLNFEKE